MADNDDNIPAPVEGLERGDTQLLAMQPPLFRPRDNTTGSGVNVLPLSSRTQALHLDETAMMATQPPSLRREETDSTADSTALRAMQTPVLRRDGPARLQTAAPRVATHAVKEQQRARQLQQNLERNTSPPGAGALPSLIDDNESIQHDQREQPGAYAVAGIAPFRPWIWRSWNASSSRRSQETTRPSMNSTRSRRSSWFRRAPSADCIPDRTLETAIEREQARADEQARKFVQWICVAGTLLVILVVAVAVGVTTGHKNDKVFPAQKPTVVPTAAPTRSPGYTNLLQQLQHLSDDPTVFEDPDSPQSMAIKWLEAEAETRAATLETAELEQRYALALFYFALGGKSWTEDLQFLAESHVCGWNDQVLNQGVACHSNSTLARSLIMNNNDAQGAIPVEIRALSSLEQFRLTNQTDESGKIQYIRKIERLAPLTNLQVLDLSGNQIKGELPVEFADMTNLQELRLNDNGLSGSIPNLYKDLTDLRVLHLQNNELIGYADGVCYELINLEELRLEGNNALQLQSLSSIRAGTSLRELRLDGVKYDTSKVPIPPTTWSKLQFWSWNTAQLSGTLPGELAGLASLQYLSMRGNWLAGTIPWGSMTNLVQLDLTMNDLTGSMPSVDHMTNLEVARLARNFLEGSLSTTVGKLERLRVLDVSFNELTGDIPTELADLPLMERLALEGNDFSLGSDDILEVVCLASSNATAAGSNLLEISLNCQAGFPTCSCCNCG